MVGIHLGRRAVLTLEDLAEVRHGLLLRKRQTLGASRRRPRAAIEAVQRCGPQPGLSGNTPPLQGVAGIRCFIPILRGGAGRFVRSTRWYVDWSEEAVAEYRRPGKNPARFQNSQFYFQDGIGVPMVASTRLTGALLERRLFDQGSLGFFRERDACSTSCWAS